MFFKKHRNIFLLLIIFLIVEVFLNPIGEFCLNDDWAYAASVKEFLNKGKFDIGSWPAMTLFVHVLWGSLFAKAFGFSFTILRISVLVLSFVCLCITEKLIFRLTSNQWFAFTMSLLMLFNPIFLCLSNSFMTDVSFFCFFLMSIYFFYRFFESEQLMFLFAGFSASLLAVFIRQLGIVVPLGFCLIIFLSCIYNKKWWKFFSISASLFTLILLLLFLFERHISVTFSDGHSFQGLFFSKKPLDFSFLKTIENLYVRLGLMMLYSGLFLFPVLISDYKFIWKKLATSSIFSKIMMGIFMLLIIFVFHYFPCGNYLYNMGIGLETTIDVMTIGQNLNHGEFNILYMFLVAISVLGNVMLIISLFNFKSKTINIKYLIFNSPFLIFVCSVMVLYLLLITISSSFFDRYSLCFAVLCLITIIFRAKGKIAFPKTVLVVIVLYSLFSILCVKDYFNYNKTKTSLIEDLELNQHVLPENINGGFEYMMWHSYSVDRISKWQDEYKPYLISFSPINKYHKVQYSSYQRYIPYKMDTIFVLQKDAP